jgi:integrase
VKRSVVGAASRSRIHFLIASAVLVQSGTVRSFLSCKYLHERKQRQCPLWPDTVQELCNLAGQRPPQERVFLNRCGQPLTRFGIHAVVERYAIKARANMPSLASKRVSPHSIRHSTATHLLRSGVDINTVRAWLGHVSIDTTNVYAEIDLEMKANALARLAIPSDRKANRRWAKDPALMAFLRSL